MKRFTTALHAAFAVFALLVALPLPAAFASDVWRMAGTFNGWNTGDDAWALTPTGEGQFEIKKKLAPGSHTFKFVKNGAWERGHFGASSAGGRFKLEMPGDDNVLRINAEAVYRVTLNVKDRSWGYEVSEVDAPVVVARVFGEPVVGQAMVIDLRESMWPGQRERVEAGWTVTASGDARARVAQEAGSGRYTVTPSAPGSLGVKIEITAGVQTAEQAFSFEVKNEAAAVTGTVFEYRPASDAGVWSAHLVGDFNHWTAPPSAGTPGTEDGHGILPMRSRADGSFFVGMPLTDGAYRYRIVINGDEPILDPANTAAPVMGNDARPASLKIVGKTPRDYPAPAPHDINAEAMRHNPEMDRDFHAVSADLGLYDISVCTLPGDVEQAFVHIDAAKGTIGPALGTSDGATPAGKVRLSIPMHKSADLSGFDRWSARVMTGIKSDKITYSIALKDGKAEIISKNYTAGAVPHLHLPAWAMGAVWYQIFPDRFRNGNPLNDPHGPGVTQMPWNSDWYKVSDAEAAAWKKRAGLKPTDPMPQHRGGPLYNVVWDRRYGGDLQGIEQKFGYLKDLGVTALYMNPIFEAESMHKYDATDYRHIDDNFGAPASAGKVPERWTHKPEPADPAKWEWTPSDRYFVDQFLPAAKKHGIRVVVDGVFNHTGRPFWAFEDIEKNGVNSIYKDWFYVDFDDAGKLKSWVSWFNTGALPKFRQKPNGDLVEPVKKHIFDITTRWMDPNGDGNPSDGVDGWRLDVALDVGLPFWRDWRKHVKTINPDAIIIAEIWDDASQHVKGDTFDTQMHYPFAKPVVDWLGVRPGMTATQLDGRLRLAYDDLSQTNLIHQNLFASHDTDRYVSMLYNPGREYDQRNRLQDADGQDYKQGRPPENYYKMSMLGVAIQATYLGAPMIYYGDEVGIYGADDPTDRKPFPWPDTGEPENPTDKADWEMHKQYAKWFNLRQDAAIGPVLRYGSIRHLTTDRDDAFAFTRELNGVRVVVVVNRGETPFDASRLLPTGTSGAVVASVGVGYWVLE
ncbi:MAG: alpha-amylase family glycosyl hydrolase [Phycisphaerales bacterium]